MSTGSLTDKQLYEIVINVLTEIERHQRKPISKGEVVIPILLNVPDGKQVLRELRKRLNGQGKHHEAEGVMAIGLVTVYVDPTHATDPVMLRGNTALMYIVPKDLPASRYGTEVLESTMNLTLMTARFNGLGGHIIRV